MTNDILNSLLRDYERKKLNAESRIYFYIKFLTSSILEVLEFVNRRSVFCP